MEQQQVFEKVIEILKPFVKSTEALAHAGMETSILGDLKVNSARLVDIVLEIEDIFQMAVTDEQSDKVRSVGDAVTLIMAQKSQ